MKTCRVCNEQKPLDEFPVNRIKKDNRATACKLCSSAYARNYGKKKLTVTDGIFNVDKEMSWAADTTPNNLYSGCQQMVRIRIDHTITIDEKFSHTTFKKTA
jgi:hypothetical protein